MVFNLSPVPEKNTIVDADINGWVWLFVGGGGGGGGGGHFVF